MANLNETPVYEPSVFKLEENTPVLGGDIALDSEGNPTAGHSNVQGQQLANRTAFLKQRLDEIDETLAEVDPFGQYILREEIGIPNGVCDLDESGTIPIKRLPPIDAGETNGGVNIGAGEGIYASKEGFDLQFKSLVAGNNVTITTQDDTLTITASVDAGDLPGIYIGEEGTQGVLGSTLLFSDDFTVSQEGDVATIGVVFPEIPEPPTPISSTDQLAEGQNNLYFTKQRVLGTDLSGLSTPIPPSAITPIDTVLGAFGKTQSQINALQTRVDNTLSLAMAQAVALSF